MSRNVLISLVS